MLYLERGYIILGMAVACTGEGGGTSAGDFQFVVQKQDNEFVGSCVSSQQKKSAGFYFRVIYFSRKNLLAGADSFELPY